MVTHRQKVTSILFFLYNFKTSNLSLAVLIKVVLIKKECIVLHIHTKVVTLKVIVCEAG